MPKALFLDVSTIDFDQHVFDVAKIESINPQRGHMRHLDGIVYVNDGASMAVGYKDVRDDEFWVEGHIPGRPLLPGVLMIEAAAQLCAIIMKHRMPELNFVGFVGCEACKFRMQVPPGKRLVLIGREVQLKPRRFICDVQGVVDGELAFEARITGMPI